MGAHSSCSSTRLLITAQNVSRLTKNRKTKKEKGHLWQKQSLHKMGRNKNELERTGLAPLEHEEMTGEGKENNQVINPKYWASISKEFEA